MLTTLCFLCTMCSEMYVLFCYSNIFLIADLRLLLTAIVSISVGLAIFVCCIVLLTCISCCCCIRKR